MTIVNTVVTAAMAALQGAAPVVGRVRLRPLSSTTLTAVVVRPVSSEVFDAPDLTGYPYAWNTLIAVECYARSGTATAPDVAVDALLEATYARLMADPTLGGAVLALQPQEVSYDFDADGDQTTCATLVFSVRHKTAGTTFS